MLTTLAQSTVEATLLDEGILGMAVLVLGWFGVFMFRRLVKERDELAAQREAMIATLLEVVPLVKRSTEIMEQRKTLDDKNQETMREVADLLRDIRRDRGMWPS